VPGGSRKKTFREIVASVTSSSKRLRGSTKLAAALDAFGVDPRGKVCLDVGASTGGFTSELLAREARRVYAVDAGHGQLLGSLRQDPRVVNLEATNVGDLTSELVDDAIDLVTVDVSYLALGRAVAQLDRVSIVLGAELVGLVKPMFELALGTAPTDEASLDRAIGAAVAALTVVGWEVVGRMPSPARGARGSIEGFVHARRGVRGPSAAR
jgi:23S rRNA (cytidine1920-2'-O)/16S rRNA (cytidine1409-2'-O)-methyltransferase